MKIGKKLTCLLGGLCMLVVLSLACSSRSDLRLVGTWELGQEEYCRGYGMATLKSGTLEFRNDGTATLTYLLEQDEGTITLTKQLTGCRLIDKEGNLWLKFSEKSAQGMAHHKLRVNLPTPDTLEFSDWTTYDSRTFYRRAGK